MLKSKLQRVVGMVPNHLRPIMAQLENVTTSMQTDLERTNAYMAVMADLSKEVRNEMIAILGRMQRAMMEDQQNKISAENRKQRRKRLHDQRVTQRNYRKGL